MHRLHVLFIKLRLFNWRDPEYWLWDVWLQDPYDQMCCNGHECGCRGSTHYGWWQYLLNGWPSDTKDADQ